MAFVERRVTYVEWNEDNKGFEIVGRLESVEEVAYRDGPGLVFTISSLTTRGEVIRFRGASRLNMQLHKSDVGKLISVTYNGEDKTKEVSAGMNFPKNFTVKVDDDSVDSRNIASADVSF
jgi:hypothetical protein